MDGHPKLVFVFLVTTLLISLCASLENGQFYHIRTNSTNNRFGKLSYSYLKVEIGGIACRNLGSVGVSSSFEPSSAAFQWQFLVFHGNLTFLDVSWNDRGLHLNELSRIPDERNCFTLYRSLNITRVSLYMHTIQDVDSGNCLISKGNNNRVTWDECNENERNQQWEFVKATRV